MPIATLSTIDFVYVNYIKIAELLFFLCIKIKTNAEVWAFCRSVSKEARLRYNTPNVRHKLLRETVVLCVRTTCSPKGFGGKHCILLQCREWTQWLFRNDTKTYITKFVIIHKTKGCFILFSDKSHKFIKYLYYALLQLFPHFWPINLNLCHNLYLSDKKALS
jgi:hypothetical protein